MHSKAILTLILGTYNTRIIKKLVLSTEPLFLDLRFMVDTTVVGCSWIELPRKSWKLRGHQGHNLPLTTRCQLEADVAWDGFIAHAPEGEWLKVAPFRILSFDIECAGRKGRLIFSSIFFSVI